MLLSNEQKLGLLIFRWFKDFQIRHDMLLLNPELTGLRASHSAITVFLAERPHRLSELAGLNGMRPQSILKLVNELEELGYVERVTDSTDSRAKLIQFTGDGRKILEASSNASSEIYAMYKPLFEKHGGDLDGVLKQLELVLKSDEVAGAARGFQEAS